MGGTVGSTSATTMAHRRATGARAGGTAAAEQGGNGRTRSSPGVGGLLGNTLCHTVDGRPTGGSHRADICAPATGAEVAGPDATRRGHSVEDGEADRGGAGRTHVYGMAVRREHRVGDLAPAVPPYGYDGVRATQTQRCGRRVPTERSGARRRSGRTRPHQTTGSHPPSLVAQYGQQDGRPARQHPTDEGTGALDPGPAARIRGGQRCGRTRHHTRRHGPSSHIEGLRRA